MRPTSCRGSFVGSIAAPSPAICPARAACCAGCIEPSQRSRSCTRRCAICPSSRRPRPLRPGRRRSGGVGRPSRPSRSCSPRSTPVGRPTARPPPGAAAQRSAEGVQLNFDQAEIRDVIKVILGDILHRSYTVDTDVQGQVTLSTSAPMAEGDLLAVLETVLRANGATLVETSPGRLPRHAGRCRDRPLRGAAAGRQAGPGPARLRHHDRAAAQHLRDLGGPVHPAAGGLARGHPDRSRPQRDPVQRHGRPSGRTWSRPWPTSTSTGWPASRSACSRCSAPMPRRSSRSCRRSSRRSTRPAPSPR